MSARAALPVLSIVMLAVTLSTRSAGAGAWSLAPGESYAELRGSGFTADSYHDLEGNRGPLPGSGTVERRGVEASIESGWKKHLSVQIVLPFEGVTRRLGGTGAVLENTTTGLGDAHLGFRWNFANARHALALQLDWKAPLGYDRTFRPVHADSVLSPGPGADATARRRIATRTPLGDGQQDVTGALHFGLSLPMIRGFAQASAGYRYRFEDPADEFVATADVAAGWRSLQFAARYSGELPVGDGTTEADKTTLHLVGPAIVYHVDDHLDMTVGSMHTASAKNALHMDRVYVAVAFKQTRLDRQQGFLGGASAH